MINYLFVLLIFIIPAIVMLLCRRFPGLASIGNVVLCCIIGFAINLLPLNYDRAILSTASSIVVAVAIPLMLFSINLFDSRITAGNVMKGFGLQIVAAVVVSVIAAIIANNVGMKSAAAYSGMTTGLYIGGTPNLLSVGLALTNGNMNTISALVVSDTIVGCIYFMFIMVFGKRIYGRVLGKPTNMMSDNPVSVSDDSFVYDEYIESDAVFVRYNRTNRNKLILILALAIGCFGVGVGLEFLINGNLNGSLFIVTTVSILGVVGGMIKPIRAVKGSYNLGQYLVLVFSTGLGMSIDFSILCKEMIPVFVFCICVQMSIIGIHMLACKLFRIDGDTALITSIAGIYGPPFIIPIADLLDNRNLILSGVICGVMGLAIGNIFGLCVGELLLMIL